MEFMFSALLAFFAIAYLFYPLFASAPDKVTEAVVSGVSIETRRAELFAELDFEFQAGKISKESYDAAKAEIESLQ